MSEPLELVVLAGLPGAGKSTVARALYRAGAGRMVLLSSAPIRLHNVSSRAVMGRLAIEADQALAGGLGVIVDAPSVNPEQRAGWLALADRRHATPRLVVVHVALEVAHRRQLRRPRRGRVPLDALERYEAALTALTAHAPTEGWVTITHYQGDTSV
jgi:predicted kinase